MFLTGGIGLKVFIRRASWYGGGHVYESVEWTNRTITSSNPEDTFQIHTRCCLPDGCDCRVSGSVGILPTRRHFSFEPLAGVNWCWIPVGIIFNVSTGYYTKLSVSVVSNKSSMQNYPECNSIMRAKNITILRDCRSLKDRGISKITIAILRRPVWGNDKW